MSILLIWMLILVASIEVHAQKTMDVSKFSRLDNDLMARVTKPVRDTDEGKLCALIRVVTNLRDIEVRADALGIVKEEKHNGEVWLYIPYGAKSISFTHQGYFPLLYQYPISIDEATVYELQLSSYETATGGISQKLNTQMFVLTHNPDDATVYIDDMEVPTEHGVFAAMMSKGEHKYRVTTPQYEEVEGSFELADQPIRETVNMRPLFGTFQLFTLPENNFNVSINGRKVGVSPYKSERLEPGRYRIRIEKEQYYPVDTLIRLREGDELQLTCTLTSFADSLFYNRQLGGRKISFGVNVGYLQPFATSSSGGGYTGSLINYALGDSRENVSYSSQSGFMAGVMADLRIYKNLYIVAGVNFAQYKYSNSFNEPIKNAVVRSYNDEVYQGDMINSYKEDYTLHFLEIPILASYRFVLTKTGSLHLNFGPYVSVGLSAKMKWSGSSECSGLIFKVRQGVVDYTQSYGNFVETDHKSAEFDLYSKQMRYTTVTESGYGLGIESEKNYKFEASPFNRFNMGIQLGVDYELRGFQVGVGYKLQLTNMANSKFWETVRVPAFNDKTGENNMSGYSHRVHSLVIRIGYILRY